jgi:electron transport complex protein RnfC
MDGFWPTFIRRNPTPPRFVERTVEKPSPSFLSPQLAIVPLQETPQEPYQCLLKAKDEVVVGQKIGERGSPPFVVSIHASISGKVREIDAYPSSHGYDVTSVVIESNGKEETCRKISPESGGEAQIEALLDAGIPLDYGKLSERKTDVLLVNGTEFEPCITVHHRILREKAAQVIRGLKTVMAVFSIPRAVVCVEKNQPSLLNILKSASEGTAEISIRPVLKAFPPAAEAILLKEVSKKKESSNSNGVHSVDAAHLLAVDEAVTQGIPFIERLVTVSGSGVSSPQDIRVRIGTSFGEILTHCGGDLERITQIIMGGALMGISQYSSDVPVTQKTPGILALVTFPIAEGHESKIYMRGPCVRCAKCVDCCPVSILPNMLATYCEKKRFEEAVQKGLFVCIDCGLCSYVCPARIPLAQILKAAKSRRELRPVESS